MPNEGQPDQWVGRHAAVRFCKDGKLVIGVVEYVSEKLKWITLDAGEVSDEAVLEWRR